MWLWSKLFSKYCWLDTYNSTVSHLLIAIWPLQSDPNQVLIPILPCPCLFIFTVIFSISSIYLSHITSWLHHTCTQLSLAQENVVIGQYIGTLVLPLSDHFCPLLDCHSHAQLENWWNIQWSGAWNTGKLGNKQCRILLQWYVLLPSSSSNNSYLILAWCYIAPWDLTQKANKIVMNTHIMHFQCLAHVATPMTSLAVLLMLRSLNVTVMGKWHKLLGFLITTKVARVLKWLTYLLLLYTLMCIK